jgi:nucleoside-diphosphate kinase
VTERTFSIIKPDATRRNLTGAINAVIEAAGLRIVAQRRVKLTEAQAKKFYEVHAGSGRRQRRPEVPRSDGRDQPG